MSDFRCTCVINTAFLPPSFSGSGPIHAGHPRLALLAMRTRDFSDGVCFGFEFHSELPLATLRGGTGAKIVVVEGPVDAATGALVAEWPEIKGQRAHAAIYLDQDDLYQVTVGKMARFLVNTRSGSIRAHLADGLPTEVKEGLLFSTPAALCVSDRGGVAIHSGSVDIGGVSLLLAASGSRGKTTLTAGFHNAGFRALADDLTCCDTAPAAVLPGPAMLRLRPDSAAVLEMVDTTPHPVMEGKVHFLIDRDRRGTGDPIPLGGIVFLEWEATKAPRLEPISMAEAIARLWRLSFYLPTEEDRRRCFEGVVDVLKQAPAWVLFRDRDYRQLPLVVNLIADRCSGRVP